MNDILRIFLAIGIGVACGIIIGNMIAGRMHRKRVYRQFIYQRNMYDLGLINHMATRRDMPIVVRLDCMGNLIYALLNNFSMKHKLKEDDAKILKDWEDIMNSCRRTISVDLGYSQDIVSNFATCVSNWYKARNYLPMFEQMQIAHDLYTIFKLTVYEHEQELAKQQAKDKKQAKSTDGKKTSVVIADELHSAPVDQKKPTAGEVVQALMDAASGGNSTFTQNPDIHMTGDGATAKITTGAGTAQYNPR